MRIAVLLTSHFYRQKRRGSMHWLADELVRAGWCVRFVTVGYSRVSFVLGDVRLKALDAPPPAGRYQVAPGIEQIFFIPPFHPIDLRSPSLNALVRPLMSTFPLFWRRELRAATADATLIVAESGLSLMLAPLLKRTGAKLVYRVNDDIRVMRVPPILRENELRYAAAFDRISVASPILAQRFAFLGTVGLDPMGLDEEALEEEVANPYGAATEPQIVCAGTSHFDRDAVLAFAQARPHWHFHVIGRLRQSVLADNVTCHGEKTFADTVPFIRHATYGIAPYLNVPGVEYQVHHSNRLQLYAYYKLPTLAPERMLHADAPFLLGYDPKDPASFDRAAAALESKTWTDGDFPRPARWKDLAAGILEVFS